MFDVKEKSKLMNYKPPTSIPTILTEQLDITTFKYDTPIKHLIKSYYKKESSRYIYHRKIIFEEDNSSLDNSVVSPFAPVMKSESSPNKKSSNLDTKQDKFSSNSYMNTNKTDHFIFVFTEDILITTKYEDENNIDGSFYINSNPIVKRIPLKMVINLHIIPKFNHYK